MSLLSSITKPGTRKLSIGIVSALVGVTLLSAPQASARLPEAVAPAPARPALLQPVQPALSQDDDAAKPTVVLVHGAFADASGWAVEIKRLERRGYPVIAPANPLRGVASDSAYIASVLATITGPIVLVGHSYGGEVITNAATGNPNVKALVYIAAFAPKRGETSGGLAGLYPGSMLTPENLIFRPFPQEDGTTGTDGYINPDVFHEAFCADVPSGMATVMSATQRPASLTTLGEPSGVPAWRTIPSWYLIAKQDMAIPPAAQRFMADRMNAQTIAINSSHVAMISHPYATTQLILDAARS